MTAPQAAKAPKLPRSADYNVGHASSQPVAEDIVVCQATVYEDPGFATSEPSLNAQEIAFGHGDCGHDTAGHGRFTVWPGSHRRLHMHRDTVHGGVISSDKRESYRLARDAVLHDTTPMEFTGVVGDAVFWHPRLLHSAGLNRSADRGAPRVRVIVPCDYESADRNHFDDMEFGPSSALPVVGRHAQFSRGCGADRRQHLARLGDLTDAETTRLGCLDSRIPLGSWRLEESSGLVHMCDLARKPHPRPFYASPATLVESSGTCRGESRC